MTTARPAVRRRRAAALSLVGVLTLGGCVGLPSSSGVDVGKAVDADTDDEPLVVEPLSAPSFDDPRAIATGFLKAQMSSHDGYRVARSFLTGAARSAWQPGAAVTVFSAEREMSATRPDTGTVTVSVPVVATITADGHLHRTAPTRRSLDFDVVHTSGGWRLASVPTGLGVWLSNDDLARLYDQVDVYYPSDFGQSLVADPRWLPRQGLTTALARATLSAPPAWLAPAVARPFPSGTRLSVDAVPVVDGTAEVDLTADATRADDGARKAIWASVTATLAQSPEVRSVNVTAASSRLEAQNLPRQVSSPDALGYPRPQTSASVVISRNGTELAWTAADATSADSGTTAQARANRPRLPAVPASWTLLAAGQGGREVAAVSSDHTSVRRWHDGQDAAVDSVGTDLVRPSFDAVGWLWTAGRAAAPANAPGSSPSGQGRSQKAGTSSAAARAAASGGTPTIWAISTASSDDEVVPLQITGLGNQRVTALSLSPDGARIALVLDAGGRHKVVVAAVERDARGVPRSLGPFQDQGLGARDVEDVAWLDGSSLALVADLGGGLEPAAQLLDDAPHVLGRVPGITGIVATGAGEGGLFVRASGGAVYTRLGASWDSFLSGGDVIVPSS